METNVILILLIAAIFHAGWNAVMKDVKLEPVAKTMLLYLVAALLCAPLVFSFGFPSEQAIPYLLVSVATSNVYLFALMYAFRDGHMSQVYPIVRGSSVLLTAIISVVFFGEQLGLVSGVGIAAVAVGVLLISMPARNGARRDDQLRDGYWGAAGFALLAALFLALGLIVDGLGARASGNPYSYIGAKFVLTALGTTIIALSVRGPGVFNLMAKQWKSGLAAGFLSCAVYGIGIWAMTVEVIPKVAAVRDTSILFAAAIAYLFLGERLRLVRVAATIAIVAGVLCIDLG